MLVIVLVLVALSACRPPPAPASPPAPAPVGTAGVGGGGRGDTTCELAPGPVTFANSLSVALLGPVDPAHAPVPASDAERLVFPELYETLVRVDCVGRILTALARSWAADSGGHRWTFTLRDDARFARLRFR